MNDELPGMLAVAKGVAEQKFPHTMDAQVWAREFMKNNPNAFRAEIDEGTMLGWFANAIMAGYDTASARSAIEAYLVPPGGECCRDWCGEATCLECGCKEQDPKPKEEHVPW